MNFSWSVSTFKEWCWEIGGTFTRRTAKRHVRQSFPVQGRLAVNLPLGSCRISGYDGADLVLDLDFRAFTQEQANAVSFTTQQRDGVTSLLIDGPFSGAHNLATVKAELQVPWDVDLDMHSGMGSINAQSVGKISAHTNMGSVEIGDALRDCDVHSNMGNVSVRLSPQWRGAGISIHTNMGNATLIVPPDVKLECDAASSMGKVEVNAGSAPGAPPAKVRSHMGNVKIVTA